MAPIINIDPPTAGASSYYFECCINVGNFLHSVCEELNTTRSFITRLQHNVSDVYELRKDYFMAISPDVKKMIGSIKECVKAVSWLTSHTEHNLLKNENFILKSQVDIYAHIVQLMKLEREHGLNCALTIACFRQMVQPLVLLLHWIESLKKIIYEITLMCETIAVHGASIECDVIECDTIALHGASIECETNDYDAITLIGTSIDSDTVECEDSVMEIEV